MNPTNTIEEIANEIVNYFMLKGAIISKQDYDFLKQSLLEVQQEELKKMTDAILMSKEGWIEQGRQEEKKNMEKECNQRVDKAIQELKGGTRFIL